MAKKTRTNRGPGRPRKVGKSPVKKKRREPSIVVKATAGKLTCPRCGSSESIDLKRKSTAGVGYYFCWSEECKSSGVRPGRGRSFVVRSDGKKFPPDSDG